MEGMMGVRVRSVRVWAQLPTVALTVAYVTKDHVTILASTDAFPHASYSKAAVKPLLRAAGARSKGGSLAIRLFNQHHG
jgi:hypothetical protein